MTALTMATKAPSGNRKTGPVWAVYRPVGKTCPPCPLLDKCYASHGRAGLQMRKSFRRDDDLADWFRALPRKALVRLLVSGDLFRDGRPDWRFMRDAIAGVKARGDVAAWGYTHGWRQLSRWIRHLVRPRLVVNASCDAVADVSDALDAGWPAVTILPRRWEERVTIVEPDGRRPFAIVTCPQQTTPGVTCATCKLCLNPTRTVTTRHGKLPMVIGFKAHGNHRTVERLIGLAADRPGR